MKLTLFRNERQHVPLGSALCRVRSCLYSSLALFFSSETLDVFAHEDAVYGLSVSPVNDNIFASSSDDGRVLIWDIRESPHGGRVLVPKAVRLC